MAARGGSPVERQAPDRSASQSRGEADYLLFVNGRAAGAIEARKEGSTLTGFERQTQKYSEGIPDAICLSSHC